MKLVVLIQDVIFSVFSVLLDDSQKIVQALQGVPDPLPNNIEVTVFIPAEAVFLTSITMPKMSRSRLLQALPFALEEMLLDEIENCHFAIADTRDPIYTAVISKNKMDHYLNQLKSFNIVPTVLMPATFLIPYKEKTWSVNQFENQCIVRTGFYSGFGCDKNNLEMVTSGHAITHEEISPLALLQKYAATTLSEPPINLLQGKYRSRVQLNISKKIWYWAGAIAASCFSLLLLGQIASMIILQLDIYRTDRTIQGIYQKYATGPFSRNKMEEKLKKLSSAADRNQFLTLLSSLGNLLSGIKLDSLTFSEKKLILNLNANQIELLDQLTQKLNKQGLQVEKQNVSATGSMTKATLIIKTEDA